MITKCPRCGLMTDSGDKLQRCISCRFVASFCGRESIRQLSKLEVQPTKKVEAAAVLNQLSWINQLRS